MSSILNRRVLVLNKDWTPIGTSTVRKALKLISSHDEDGIPKARVVDEDLSVYEWDEWLEMPPGESFIRSPSRRIKIPSVIICRNKTLPRMYASFTKSAVFIRDKNQCQYCKTNLTSKKMTIDHVIPRSRGGKNNWFNCVTSCVGCNNYKGDRTPDEANMPLIKLPGKPPLILCEEPIPELWRRFV